MLHPIVEQIAPSSEQKPAILQRGRDVVVTAGAGTGKTRTLVARYLSLLAEGLPLRSVVAITFTRKAAREMRNRVRDEVRRYLIRADLGEEERQRWQGLYSKLDAARIGTIHGLCAEILRAHPAEARVDPHFEVLDEGQANILRRQAVEEALAWAADDQEVVALFALLGEWDLRSTLDRLMGQRSDAGDSFARMPGDVLAHWQKALTESQEECLPRLLVGQYWQEAVEVLRANVADDPADRLEAERQKGLTAVDGGATGPLAKRLTSLAGLEAVRLNAGRRAAWPGGKDQLDGVKDALRTLRELWQDAPEVLHLHLTPMDEARAQALPSLAALFGYACERYATLKQPRNALDFDDLEQGALALLRGNPEVLARWQKEIGAFLVDEFQDTNGRQRELVALLNGEGGRLFVVGDAKQSIFLFRGADVTVFRAERERVEGGGGIVFSLDVSYRAHRELVEGLNDLLCPVLGDEADPGRPWVEPFAPLRHHREEPNPGFGAPHIEVHLTVGKKGAGALDRAADALAGRLVDLVEGGQVRVADNGGVRPLDYGDIAILCRSSTSFGSYENALERAGVPFLTVAGRGFYGRPEVRDVLNALQALADPTDDLALVGLLRSPAMALSDAALYLLSLEQDGEATSLSDVLRQHGDGLPGADGERAERAVEVIDNLHGQVGRVSVADLLKRFLDATDYRAALLQAGQSRGARNVAKLLADAHASGIVGVGEFLEYIRTLRDAGAREGEARATGEGAVQIMSVHAAKGLEFPVVVVGDVTHSNRGSGGVLIDSDLGVLLPKVATDDAPPAIYEWGKSRADDQEAAESDRLLYVAATRARERLILSGCVGLRKDGTLGKQGPWFGKIAGERGLGLEGRSIEHDEEGARAIHLDLRVGQTPVSGTIYEPGWSQPGRPRQAKAAPVESAVPPPLLKPVRRGREHVDARTSEQERIPPQRVWTVAPTVKRPRSPAWVVGSLVHEALAVWRFPDGQFARWAEARARSHGITDARQLRDAINRSRRLLLRFQEHPLCQEMDGADRRLHEVPYSLTVDGEFHRGRIDALFLRDGKWTIVEFKTDELRNQAQLDRLLKEQKYRAQTERYVKAVEHLLGQHPRAILCLLNYAGQVRLLEEL